MKLLLFLLSIVLVSGDESFAAERALESNDVSSQETTVLQAQSSSQEIVGEKRLGKRSFGLFPDILPDTPVLPWYRSNSFGLNNGWYSDWPWYGGLKGWYKDWHRGW